jgi:RNA polymerase sigma factor (sigma-70 family)
MAAIRDPDTGTATPPQIAEAPKPSLPRDPARATALLYRKYGTAVYRFSWHMLGSREDAEDAAQATFLAVHAALASGTDVREPQAWVMKIARNECLQKITQRMRRPLTDSIDADEAIQLAAAGPSVSRQAELHGELGAASEALGRLPTSQREAFVLREWVGMSTAEIALSLGTTVSAVDALLNRARRELIRVVGGNEGVASCADTRAALADGILDRSARAHLVRCKSCRAARRAIHPQAAAVRSLVPPAVIAERLGNAVPGFASGAASGAASAAGGAAAGGTGIAAVVAKLASAPAAVKAVLAAVSAAAAVGGIAVQEHGHPGLRHVAAAPPPAVHHTVAPPVVSLAASAPVLVHFTSSSDKTTSKDDGASSTSGGSTSHTHSSGSDDSTGSSHKSGSGGSSSSDDSSSSSSHTTYHHHHTTTDDHTGSTTGSDDHTGSTTGTSDHDTDDTTGGTTDHDSDDTTTGGTSDDPPGDPSDDPTTGSTTTGGSSTGGSTTTGGGTTTSP